MEIASLPLYHVGLKDLTQVFRLGTSLFTKATKKTCVYNKAVHTGSKLEEHGQIILIKVVESFSGTDRKILHVEGKGNFI